jgi:hypothetical protein
MKYSLILNFIHTFSLKIKNQFMLCLKLKMSEFYKKRMYRTLQRQLFDKKLKPHKYFYIKLKLNKNNVKMLIINGSMYNHIFVFQCFVCQLKNNKKKT